MNPFSVFTDEELLARAMWGEARGEGYDGMYDVGWVVRNRVTNRKRWPHTFRGVILQRRQFSAFNEGDSNRKRMLNIWRLKKGDDLEAWDHAREIADNILSFHERIIDHTDGANHYHDTSIKPPYWARGKEPTVEIGRLVFYRL